MTPVFLLASFYFLSLLNTSLYNGTIIMISAIRKQTVLKLSLKVPCAFMISVIAKIINPSNNSFILLFILYNLSKDRHLVKIS